MVEKDFEAAGREILRESLEEQGFSVFSIRRQPWRFLTEGAGVRGRLTGRRFLSFNQELLVLIRSGMPILQVLDTLIERMEPGGFLEALREIRNEVKGGSILSEAFGKFPQFFPHLYVASVKAGERTGDLPITIGRYIAYQKRVEAIRAKIRSASFYPTLLTLAVVAVVLFLMLFVIPSFTQIYADAKVELPLLTRLLVAAADGLGKGISVWLPALLGALIAGRILLRSERGRWITDRLKLKLPYFSNLHVEYAISSFCRTFGTTLSSGIPAVQALQMSRGTLNNLVLEGHLSIAIRKVEEGTGLGAALDQTGFFPVIALRMIGVGETTGALSEMLGDVAEYFEGEVEHRLERLTTLIEPLMMLTMGLLIGGIVVAMYIPIFQLAGTVN